MWDGQTWAFKCVPVCLPVSGGWKVYHHKHPPLPSGFFYRWCHSPAFFQRFALLPSCCSPLSPLTYQLFSFSASPPHPHPPSFLGLSCATNNSNLNKRAKENPLVTESLEERERKGQRPFARACAFICKRKLGWISESKEEMEKEGDANARTIIGIRFNPHFYPRAVKKHTQTHTTPVNVPTHTFPLALHESSLSNTALPISTRSQSPTCSVL